MKIIGILLVKDEDLYLERVLRNAIDFCDKVIAVEGPSSDRTLEILRKFLKLFEIYELPLCEQRITVPKT